MKCWDCRKAERNFESETPGHGDVCEVCDRVHDLDLSTPHQPQGRWREQTGMERMARSIDERGGLR